MAAITTALAIGAAAVGGGLAIKGTMDARKAAQQQAEASQQQIEGEKQADAVRRKSMELDAKRRLLESVRQAQRVRAQSLTTTTAQGAGQGSAKNSAYGQTSGQFGDQLLGIANNLEIGGNLFDINSNISAAKIQYAQAGSQLAQAQALTSLGGTFISNMGQISSIGTQVFGKGGYASRLGGFANYGTNPGTGLGPGSYNPYYGIS